MRSFGNNGRSVAGYGQGVLVVAVPDLLRDLGGVGLVVGYRDPAGLDVEDQGHARVARVVTEVVLGRAVVVDSLQGE